MPAVATPAWVWIFTALFVILPVALVLFVMAATGAMARPLRRVSLTDLTVELWKRDWNQAPPADAIVVPVAPDLRMVAGIAKWVRDATADKVQREALQVAPLPVGEAFVGAGGRYRFKMAALAVVMDGQKRTTPEWITGALGRAISLATDRGARIIVLPDMTDDLVRQPNWISDQQRRDTCGPIARAMLDAAVQAGHAAENIRVWVWRDSNLDIYQQEFERLASGSSRTAPAVASAR